jgi:hypothetical protein
MINKTAEQIVTDNGIFVKDPAHVLTKGHIHHAQYFCGANWQLIIAILYDIHLFCFQDS